MSCKCKCNKKKSIKEQICNCEKVLWDISFRPIKKFKIIPFEKCGNNFCPPGGVPVKILVFPSNCEKYCKC